MLSNTVSTAGKNSTTSKSTIRFTSYHGYSFNYTIICQTAKEKAGKPRVIDRKQIIYCPGNIYSFFMLVRAIFTVPGIYLPLGQRYYMVMKERGEDK